MIKSAALVDPLVEPWNQRDADPDCWQRRTVATSMWSGPDENERITCVAPVVATASSRSSGEPSTGSVGAREPSILGKGSASR